MKNLFELFRARQWVKNLFLIFPIIFSGRFTEWPLWGNCLKGIAAFCLISSGMYIINDVFDLKKDGIHPRKSKRPLAAGTLSVPVALTVAISVLVLGGILSWQMNREFFILAVSYVFLLIIYNVSTKQVVILDVLTVAFGYLIRIWAGSAAVNVLPSLWLQMCAFSLALFLGFTKRRYEISLLKSDAAAHRGVLSHYTLYLLDQIINICSTVVIIFYGLYAISPEIVQRIGGYGMLYSVPFVVYGIFRYLYLVHMHNLGDDPGEILFADLPLMVNIFLWIGFVITVINLSQM